MPELNPFLLPIAEPTKGGGRFIEDPGAVENITFQTRGAPLDAFEQGLADALMAAFDEGHVELAELAAALNRAGSADSAGLAWTADALEAQLARSAELFVRIGGDR